MIPGTNRTHGIVIDNLHNGEISMTGIFDDDTKSKVVLRSTELAHALKQLDGIKTSVRIGPITIRKLSSLLYNPGAYKGWSRDQLSRLGSTIGWPEKPIDEYEYLIHFPKVNGSDLITVKANDFDVELISVLVN
jgi:hypothetical protein